MKKLFAIMVFILVIVISGDLLMVITKSALIANIGSIVFPSLVMGIAWKLLFKDDLEDNYKKIIPATLGIIKVILMYLEVKDVTILAVLLVLLIYPAISYFFLKLGTKVIMKSNEQH